MSRLLPLLGLLLGFVPPSAAQQSADPAPRWALGTTVQATFMEQVPTATGVGLHATRMLSGAWGVRLSVRRDATVQRDIEEGYRSLSSTRADEWSDQRRLNLTAAALWHPVDASSGRWGHTLQVHAGPSLQLQRGEQMRFLGVLEREPGSILGEPGYRADNTYLARTGEGRPLLLLTEDTNRTNVGGTMGVSYGLSYRAVTVRLGLMGRTLTNVDGVTFGVGGGLSFRL